MRCPACRPIEGIIEEREKSCVELPSLIYRKGCDFMRVTAFLLLFLLIASVIAGCAKGKMTAKDPIEVVRENADAMRQKNIDATMATIDDKSPAYANTKIQLKKIFDAYELTYELKELRIIEEKKDEARVGFVQITRKVKGPAFRDNEIKGYHILKKSGGEWKISNTVIENISYLDNTGPQKGH